VSEPKYKVGDRVRVLPVPILQSNLHGREGAIVHISQTTGPEPLFSIVLDGDEQKACGLRACEIEPAPVQQPPVQSAGPRFKKGDLVQNNMGRKATVVYQDEAKQPKYWVRFWDTGQGEWYHEADLFPQAQSTEPSRPTPKRYARCCPRCKLTLDPYRISDIYGHSGKQHHLSKKALCAGKRGHKDLRKDLQDVIDTAQRWLDMLTEDEQNASTE